MAAHKYGLQLDDADLIDTIETLTEHGETIAGNGGVLPARVAEELPFAPKTIAKHCSQLAEAGRLQAARGFHDGQQRKSYLPADDEGDQKLVTDGGVARPSWNPTAADADRNRTCRNCGSQVTRQFARVFGDNRDVVHACPDCSILRTLDREASNAGGGDR
ncbi:hypothetical protein SAMN05216285_4144 [Natrinema salifodinae]|uniref:Uncharacterized protein n=1 Tax=Natrinema salifodinae TaxID=1202768 RepID=A0A1I0QZ90_9EURY|nr:hypothetical protein [Natrinema salifodinae]SEW32778.1 hypothetical protein SAMN05216285_4144 [Natrinema salifodinae]